MLFFPSALFPQLRLHFLQKLKYYTLGNKDYSRKLLWVVVSVNVNSDDVRGTASALIKSRNKALVGSMNEFEKTISV